ncbi:MAG: hypothetical protein QOF16_287 [Actinomycetota bacterium]|nr:hypothetical protein [Actinomycetota bacterium]MEA2486633.1 hypothetical protein [Actinomycetota bacterium]
MGFEPTEGVNPHSLSRRARYGRFGTPPSSTTPPNKCRGFAAIFAFGFPARRGALRGPSAFAGTIFTLGVCCRLAQHPWPTLLARMPDGDVRERPKRHDWKSCDPRGSKGSNPFVSARPVDYPHGRSR